MDHRQLKFQQPEAGIAEAERLATCSTTTSGHYTHGQIIEHLARTFDVLCGHMPPPHVPWYMNILGRLVRNSVINNTPKPGFKLPKNAQDIFWPNGDIELSEAMQHLRDSFARYRATETLPKHPFFGHLTRERHDTLQCRHLELHLGFIRPANA